MCLRGAKSSQGRTFRYSMIDLAVAEAQVPQYLFNTLTASFVCTSTYLTLYPFLFTLVFVYLVMLVVLKFLFVLEGN